MFGSFGSDFRSSKTKMDWKNLGIFCAHDSLYHLLPCKGVCFQDLLLNDFIFSMTVTTLWKLILHHLLKQTLRAFRETHLASVMLDSGRNLLKKAHEAWLQTRRLSKQAVSTRNRKNTTYINKYENAVMKSVLYFFLCCKTF